jgi:hypothetical protein
MFSYIYKTLLTLNMGKKMKKITTLITAGYIMFILTGCGAGNLQPDFQDVILSQPVTTAQADPKTKVIKNSLMSEQQEANLIEQSFNSPDRLQALLGLAESIADLKPNSQSMLMEMTARSDKLAPAERVSIMSQIAQANLPEDGQEMLIDFSFKSNFRLDALTGIARFCSELTPNAQGMLIEMVTKSSAISPVERQKIITEIIKANLKEDKQEMLIEFAFKSPNRLEALIGVVRGVSSLTENAQNMLIEMVTRSSAISPVERQKIIAELARGNNTPGKPNKPLP